MQETVKVMQDLLAKNQQVNKDLWGYFVQNQQILETPQLAVDNQFNYEKEPMGGFMRDAQKGNESMPTIGFGRGRSVWRESLPTNMHVGERSTGDDRFKYSEVEVEESDDERVIMGKRAELGERTDAKREHGDRRYTLSRCHAGSRGLNITHGIPEAGQQAAGSGIVKPMVDTTSPEEEEGVTLIAIGEEGEKNSTVNIGNTATLFLILRYSSPHSGEFSGENIRLGSRGDSYYEYLIKVWLQQGTHQDSNIHYLREMYEEAMRGVRHLLVHKSIPNGLVFVGELPYGPRGDFSPKMDHLVCFLPGTLALGATKGITKRKAMEENLLSIDDLENLKLAEDLAKTCFEMYSVTSTGLAPEIAYFHTEGYNEGGLDGGNKSSEYVNDIIIKHADRHNLLRPETVESLFLLYRITEDAKYREWGWRIFEAFERYTKIDSGGYSSLDDVTTLPPHKRDKMETFFLGETLKYLYLMFGNSSVIPLNKFVFNTEAHPIPIKGSLKND
ncbi:hypothetical protein GIB67_031670 [Kingdonia uniflora]|uniref:alpha-1,2-Mannosidase n=1 Tax=Kingdonia uniflora TaxID=39325 RepID=A0A7J7NJR4_9MAGN|nr:hypothetical protein GIB67_031670 [Kingdonia uniflora]